MPSAQGYGAIPGGPQGGAGEAIANLLQAGILGNQKYQDEQQAKKDKDEENTLKLIGIGMNAKTVRPAREGEKPDLSYKGQGFIYDNTNNETDRKMNYYQNAQKLAIDRVSKEDPYGQMSDAQRNAKVFQYTAQAMGGAVGADGKISFSDEALKEMPQAVQDLYTQALSSQNAAKPRQAADAAGTPTGDAMQAARGMANPGLGMFNPMSAFAALAKGGMPQGMPQGGYTPSGATPQFQTPIFNAMGPMMKGALGALGPAVPNQTQDPNAPKMPGGIDFGALANLMRMNQQDQGQQQTNSMGQ